VAYITSEAWSKRHYAVNKGADLDASSWPTATIFTEWVAWASGLVNTFIGASSDVTDEGQTILNIIDNLLWQKYRQERVALNESMLGQVEFPPIVLSVNQEATLRNAYLNKGKKPVARLYSTRSGRRLY
jgi:hypothetical protein